MTAVDAGTEELLTEGFLSPCLEEVFLTCPLRWKCSDVLELRVYLGLLLSPLYYLGRKTTYYGVVSAYLDHNMLASVYKVEVSRIETIALD